MIEQLKKEDHRFHMEGGSWTNNISWVKGYESLLGPMERGSSLFYEKVLKPGLATERCPLPQRAIPPALLANQLLPLLGPGHLDGLRPGNLPPPGGDPDARLLSRNDPIPPPMSANVRRCPPISTDVRRYLQMRPGVNYTLAPSPPAPQPATNRGSLLFPVEWRVPAGGQLRQERHVYSGDHPRSKQAPSGAAWKRTLPTQSWPRIEPPTCRS